MDVTLLCPNLNCKAVLQVPEAARGKVVRCGHCGQSFRVPQKTIKPAEETAEPAAADGSKTHNDNTLQT